MRVSVTGDLDDTHASRNSPPCSKHFILIRPLSSVAYLELCMNNMVLPTLSLICVSSQSQCHLSCFTCYIAKSQSCLL